MTCVGKQMGHCDIRKQISYEVVLLVYYYPSIGDHHIAMNWLHLYQVWRKEENVLFFYGTHWVFATHILSASFIISL